MQEDQNIAAEGSHIPTPEQEADLLSDKRVAQISDAQRAAENILLSSATRELQSTIGPLLPTGTIIEHADLLGDEEGWNSKPFRVRIAGKPDHIFLLLKTKNAPDTVNKLTHLQPLLSEIAATTPGKLPQITYSSNTPPVFIGCPALPGRPLDKIVANLQPNDRSSLVKTMAETLGTIHSVPLEKAKQHDVKEEDLVGKYEYYFGEDFLSKEIRPVLNAKEYNVLHAYAARALQNPDFMNYRPEFVHGDLGSGNVLFDAADRSVGIIDWEHASISDADKDIHNFCRTFPPDLQEAFLQHYPMRNTTKPREKMIFLDMYRALILVSFGDKKGLEDLKEAISKLAPI